MMDTQVDRELLEKIADLVGKPVGAFNIRKDTGCDGRQSTEHIEITGKTDGNDVALTSPKAAAYYLKREGSIFSIYSGTATAIDNAPTTAPTVSLSAGQLAVSAEGLRAIRLYSVSGTMVGQAPATDARRAELSLQGLAQGGYLLRIEAGARTTTYRFMHRTTAPLR